MVFTYHEITQKPCGYLYSATSDRLAEHVSFLRSLAGTVPGGCADHSIVFDDGHASQYRYGLSVLTEHGISGTFFVTAGWTDSRAQYMTSAQLRELSSLGHFIHSHGWSHKLLTQCSPAELKTELRRSREVLEDMIGSAVDAISMPGGRWNDRVLAGCGEAGYRVVYTSDPWLAAASRCGVAVEGRVMVKRTMDASALAKLLHTDMTRFSHQRMCNAIKSIVKRGLGDPLYAAVWRYTAASRTRLDVDSEYTADYPCRRPAGERGEE